MTGTTGFQKRLHCKTCGEPTLHVKSNVEANKTLLTGMAALSVLTCGLFFPIALGWSFYHHWQIGNQRWHCQICGTGRR